MLVFKIIRLFLLKYYKERINLFKTIYVNLLYLPYKEGKKFPILIYGKCRIIGRGKIRLLDNVYYGKIKIGVSDPVRSCFDKTYLGLDGELLLGNDVVIRRGGKIQIYHHGKIQFDDNVFVGDNNTFISNKYIHIGSNTRIGNNNLFMDTDFHYIVNTLTKSVRKNTSAIEIGENNWLGGSCTIKKGAKTPKGTILAGPYSMISKDYTTKISEYCVIGGSPAKLIAENMRRINNDEVQMILDEYFANNSELYQFDENENLDVVCLPKNVRQRVL